MQGQERDETMIISVETREKMSGALQTAHDEGYAAGFAAGMIIKNAKVRVQRSQIGDLGFSPCPPGTKYDDEKPRWSLLPWDALEQVVKVLTHGATKYADDNWKDVKPHTRYLDAALRHITAWARGEKMDADSGLPQLACAVFVAISAVA